MTEESIQYLIVAVLVMVFYYALVLALFFT